MKHLVTAILSLPCLLLLNDANPVTGEWNPVINLIGFLYAIAYGIFINRKYREYINKFKDDKFD